jgi:hypothetical protein
LLANGTRALTGHWNAGAFNITTTGTGTFGDITSNGDITLENGEVISNDIAGELSFKTGGNKALKIDLDAADPQFRTDTGDEIRFYDAVAVYDTNKSLKRMLVLDKTNYNLTTGNVQGSSIKVGASTGGGNTMVGLTMTGQYTGSQSQTGYIRGFWGLANQSGTGTISELTCLRGSVNCLANGDVTIANGMNTLCDIATNITSDVVTWTDYRAGGIDLNTTGTCSGNAYNFYGKAHANNGGSFTGNAYGLYLEAQTEGAVNWQIYSAGGNSSHAGNFRIGSNVAPTVALDIDGTIKLKEQDDADADTAAYGQIWVKTATPNQLWFTDDADNSVQLGVGGGSGKTAVVSHTLDATEIKALATANTNQGFELLDLGSLHIPQFLGATLRFIPGSEVLTESGDNLLIRSNNGLAMSDILETTGWIDQLSPIGGYFWTLAPVSGGGNSKPAEKLYLFNNGSNFAGNASDDCSLVIEVVYVDHNFN